MLTILQITSFVLAGATILSFIIFSILMKKYQKSAIHTTKEENGMIIETITRDPKLKKQSIIMKTITITLFVLTFTAIILYCINGPGNIETTKPPKVTIFHA